MRICRKSKYTRKAKVHPPDPSLHGLPNLFHQTRLEPRLVPAPAELEGLAWDHVVLVRRRAPRVACGINHPQFRHGPYSRGRCCCFREVEVEGVKFRIGEEQRVRSGRVRVEVDDVRRLERASEE